MPAAVSQVVCSQKKSFSQSAFISIAALRDTVCTRSPLGPITWCCTSTSRIVSSFYPLPVATLISSHLQSCRYHMHNCGAADSSAPQCHNGISNSQKSESGYRLPSMAAGTVVRCQRRHLYRRSALAGTAPLPRHHALTSSHTHTHISIVVVPLPRHHARTSSPPYRLSRSATLSSRLLLYSASLGN